MSDKDTEVIRDDGAVSGNRPRKPSEILNGTPPAAVKEPPENRCMQSRRFAAADEGTAPSVSQLTNYLDELLRAKGYRAETKGAGAPAGRGSGIAGEGAREPVSASAAAEKKKALIEKVCGNAAEASESEKLEFLLLPFFKEPPEAFSKELIRSFGSLRAVLLSSPAELKTVKGMPSQAALTISQYASLLYGADAAATGYKGKIDSPEKAVKILSRLLGYGKKERFYVLHLDGNNRLITAKQVAEGSFSKVSISTAYLVAEAVTVGAKRVIMAHNHPNNASFPSDADIDTTKNFSEAYYSVGIRLLDHIIIAGLSDGAFCSLARSERALKKYFDSVPEYRCR